MSTKDQRKQKVKAALFGSFGWLFCTIVRVQPDVAGSQNPPVYNAPTAPGRIPQTQALAEISHSTKLVTDEMEARILEGFKKFFVSRTEKPPSVLLDFKPGESARASQTPDGWNRITRAEIEPYLTRPLRRTGVLVYDQPADSADLLLEIAVSVKQVPYYGTEGNGKKEIPDIQIVARRARDNAIIGQSSTFELLGTIKAWSIYQRTGEAELLRATALTLMEDMIINTAESGNLVNTAEIKKWQVRSLSSIDYHGGNSGPISTPSRQMVITREDYLNNADRPNQPLRPVIKDYFKDIMNPGM